MNEWRREVELIKGHEESFRVAILVREGSKDEG